MKRLSGAHLQKKMRKERHKEKEKNRFMIEKNEKKS
jgi:hypothetical protein